MSAGSHQTREMKIAVEMSGDHRHDDGEQFTHVHRLRWRVTAQ